MRLWPRNLRGQLVLLILAALIAAQGLSLWVFVGERGLAVRAALGLEAAGRAANVVRLLEEAPPELHDAILRAADSPLVRFRRDAEPLVGHLGHDESGEIAARIRTLLGDSIKHEIRVELHEIVMDDMHPFARPLSSDEVHMRRMHHGLSAAEIRLSIHLAGGGWLNVSTRFHRPPLQWPWLATLSFGLSAAIVLTAALWFLLTRLTRPLRSLGVAADRIGRGENIDRINPSGPSEVRDLSKAFNQMQERLLRFVSERTRLLGALGHDLRSPLTALRVRAEMVEEQETRERLIGTIEEMSDMVEATLAYARGVAETEPYDTVELAVFLDDLAQELTETGGAVEINAQSGLNARLRLGSMRRALRNLLENAVRYGDCAEAVLTRADGLAQIVITDNGPGIPEEELERVFEPFVRVETSRSRETGGTGLGLAIARSIILAHGGEVELANRSGGGLAVTVRLPLERAGQTEDVNLKRKSA